MTIKELLAKAQAIRDKAKSENRSMTTAERGVVQECLDKIETMREAGKTEDRLGRMESELNKPLPLRGSGFERMPGVETAVATTGGMLADRSYRSLFGQAVTNDGWRNAEEYLQAVASGLSDQRFVRGIMNETLPSLGGFSVPTEYAQQWLDSSLPSEIVRRLAQIWPMASESRMIPAWDSLDRSDGSTHGGFEMQWLAEMGTATSQSGKLRLVSLQARKAAIYCEISAELEADGLGMAQQLQSALTASIGFGLDAAFLLGDGVGKPLGALASGNPSLITVSKEVGQVAGTLVYENLLKMFARQWSGGRRNCVWLANESSIPSLLTLSFPIGVGGVPVPCLSADSGGFSLFGRPVLFSEHLSTLGALNDIALVDFSQYAIGMRKEVTLDRSNVPGWQTDTISYRIILRIDGQSLWNKVLTPKNGSTSSPFINLEART